MTVQRVPEATPRRVPAQARSRRRVEQILDRAAQLVVSQGVDALTTRDIAAAAKVPVASLYQYFSDKEDVLLALAARDMDEMDDQVATDLTELEESETLTVRNVVRTTMLAFVKVYHRRVAFVEIYLRGRTNLAVHRFGREHNARIAETLRAFALEKGLASEALTETIALLAIEIGDRVFQLAFEHDDEGDQVIVEEGITMMTAYLERYATPQGRGR